MSSAVCFKLDQSKILSSGNGLNQTANFKPVQIERICRQQNIFDSILENSFDMCGKHNGKWRKCWSPAFSFFSTMFSQAFFFSGLLQVWIMWKRA